LLGCMLLFSASASDAIGIESPNKLSGAVVNLDEKVSVPYLSCIIVFILIVILTHKSVFQFAVVGEVWADKVSFSGLSLSLFTQSKHTYHKRALFFTSLPPLMILVTLLLLSNQL
jgi:heme O synthase-like polyprenyltransferase